MDLEAALAADWAQAARLTSELREAEEVLRRKEREVVVLAMDVYECSEEEARRRVWERLR